MHWDCSQEGRCGGNEENTPEGDAMHWINKRSDDYVSESLTEMYITQRSIYKEDNSTKKKSTLRYFKFIITKSTIGIEK